MNSTYDKIQALGALYKDACQCRDRISLVQDRLYSGIGISMLEELLDFARKIASQHDEPMQDLINAMRAVLENEVHTAAGM